MPYDPRAIANWFIDRAAREEKFLTPMQLQKLVYVSHGWNLGLSGTELVHEAVEAWRWGPVFRSIYREFKEFGGDPVNRKALVLDGSTLLDREIDISDFDGENQSQTESLLERIWQVYGNKSAMQLSAMTHQSGTPWHRVVDEHEGSIPHYAVIPTSYIKEHYEHLANG